MAQPLQPNPHNETKSRRYLGWLLIGLAVAVGLLLYQPLADRITLQDASPTMIALAHQAGMNRAGELLFLRAHPQLDSDPQMETHCPAAAANSNGFIEQGCYDPQANRIYLRGMPADLQPLEATTAAYEMLHIVYINDTRGSATTLNQAIESNYAQIHTAALDVQVANFARTEPGSRDLELFSLLGTEYSGISANLMDHYAPYFTDLSANVTANNRVQSTFQTDETKLSTLKNLIANQSSAATSAYDTSINWAHAGNASEDNYYYHLYTADITAENNTISQYNQLIQQYNALVTDYDGTQPVARISNAQAQSSVQN
jgi:hypothetical protein